MRFDLLAVSVIAAAMMPTVWAKECKGVQFPDSVDVQGERLVLNGLGLRKATFLKINVYVAALYVPRASTEGREILDSHSPARLTMQFLRSVSAKELRERWTEAFQKEHALPALEERVAQLNAWMSDMNTGRRMIFTRLPNNTVQVQVDGQTRGAIPGEDFSRAFFSIWLGANPPNPELKSGLLGGACD